MAQRPQRCIMFIFLEILLNHETIMCQTLAGIWIIFLHFGHFIKKVTQNAIAYVHKDSRS